MKTNIESHGLRWSVVESLPVSESIKYGGNDREQHIANYKVSLGKAGVKTICYNFMPVLDWARTDLDYPNPDIAKICNRRLIPYTPGCGSITEVGTAQEHGCDLCKIFPGDVLGPKDRIAAQDWAYITDKCREALSYVK